MAEFDDYYEMDNQEEQPETQPETVVEPVAPAPPAAPTESVESIKAQIQKIRDNDKLSNEKQGSLLEPLYKKLLEAERAEAAPKSADPQAVDREVTSELRNAWGPHYDEKLNAVGEVVAGAFGADAVQKFKAFSATLDLSTPEHVSNMQMLADLAAPVESEMPAEQTNAAVAERLRGHWDRDADKNLEHAQRAARSIFGSLEKAESFFISRGWDESPRMQTKAMILLARLGRKIKS